MTDKVRQKEKKSPIRIGIVTCAIITQDLGCASTLCLKALRTKGDEFTRYGDNVELMGIIDCAGCPGNLGTDKLANRIRALTELDVDAIHFSSCLIDFCPFKKKFHKMINEKYPDVDVVFGTHHPPEGVTPEIHTQVIKDMVRQPKPGHVDLIKPFV
jgi:predicted metal-binding protein